MRVLHVMKITGIAGAENHLLTLLAGLRERGIDARFLLLVGRKNPVDSFVAAADRLGIPSERMVIYSHADLTLIPRLWRAFRRYQPDIAHIHLMHADLYGIPAARLARVPVVITGRHNDDAFRRRTPLRQLNHILWRWVDAGTVISDSVGRFSQEVEGAPASRLHTIPYGLDLHWTDAERRTMRAEKRAEIGLGSEDQVLGMACRLTEQKGVLYAIRAFAQIVADFPTARLVIAGDGPQRVMLGKEAGRLGILDRVCFLGWRDDARQLLAAFDVFLVPSLWEGFGLVLLEAMAQRLPVIGSTAGAIPEVVVNGETGLLVPPADPDALAGAMAALLRDRLLRLYMGLNGEDRLETEFSVARMVDKTLALYTDLRQNA